MERTSELALSQGWILTPTWMEELCCSLAQAIITDKDIGIKEVGCFRQRFADERQILDVAGLISSNYDI
jgi:hypothetical protein